MSAEFVIDRSDAGKFRFNLHAGNNQIVLTSESYESKAAAENGIESVRKNSADDKRFTRKTAVDGRDYFVLVASNGQTIGQSQMYASKSAMEKGIESVRTNAPLATITVRTS